MIANDIGKQSYLYIMFWIYKGFITGKEQMSADDKLYFNLKILHKIYDVKMLVRHASKIVTGYTSDDVLMLNDTKDTATSEIGLPRLHHPNIPVLALIISST